MKYFVLSVVLAVALFNSATGVQQYITLYTEQNEQGANMTLTKQYPNLGDLYEFMQNVSSYCAVGWLAFYTNYNFNVEGGIAFLIDHDDTAVRCQNRIFSNYKSMRFFGNIDTDLPGMSLYSKINYHGSEVYVNENGTVTGDLLHQPLSLAVTGWGNYTIYEYANNTGYSYCFESTKKVTLIPELDVNLMTIGSITEGCKNPNSTRIA